MIDVGSRLDHHHGAICRSAEGAFLVYAPLRRAAFVANATVVNSIADLRDWIVPWVRLGGGTR